MYINHVLKGCPQTLARSLPLTYKVLLILFNRCNEVYEQWLRDLLLV